MNTDKLSDKEIEKICDFINCEIAQYEKNNIYSRQIIYKILRQAQIKLIETGLVEFEFDVNSVLVVFFDGEHTYDTFLYSDYNNDILSALAHAILWAIDKDKSE